MKPLKITFSALALLMITEAKSQGLYFESNTSYNFSLGSQSIGNNSSDVSSYNFIDGTNSYTHSSELVKGSFGKGFQAGLGIGYMFNNSIGFELKAEQQFTSSYTLKSTDVSNYTDFSGSTTDYYTYTETQSGSMLKLTPSIVFQIPGDKIRPYVQAGATFGLGKMNFGFKDESNGDVSEVNYVLNGGLAIGMNGEFGVNFKITEKLSFNTGLSFSALSYAPAKAEMIEYTENGVDMLPGTTVNDREVLFVNETSYNSNSQPDPNKPEEATKMFFPYSNLGLNIGIKFSL